MIPHEWLSFDAEETIDVVTSFLAHHVDRAGAEGVVVGLSGGLDSSTTLALAVEALGPEAVDAVFLPGPTSPAEDEKLARQAGERAGVEVDAVPIGPGLQGLAGELGAEVDRGARGNLQARLRMCALYARANARDRLVLGTGNKSELLTGYFTKHGDGAADLLPIGDVYKTQARVVAEELDVPEAIRQRAPTAGLWEGQTDEAELGLAYADLDVVLAGIEAQRNDETIASAADVDVDEVARVRSMVEASAHKRAPPPVPKLGWRTPGVDWRQATNA